MSNEVMDLYIALVDLQHTDIKAEFKKLSPAEKASFLKKLHWLMNEVEPEEVATHAANCRTGNNLLIQLC